MGNGYVRFLPLHDWNSSYRFLLSLSFFLFLFQENRSRFRSRLSYLLRIFKENRILLLNRRREEDTYNCKGKYFDRLKVFARVLQRIFKWLAFYSNRGKISPRSLSHPK